MNAAFSQPTAAAVIALDFARIKIPVLPCGPDKRPLTRNGFKDATADIEKVAALWRDHPSAMIGLPTGSASGLFVVDLDMDKVTGKALGEATLAALGLSYLLDSVPSVRTPSGGWHLYFRDVGLGCTIKRIGPGVDTRGEGGYIIAPGSVSPGGAYVLNNGPITLATLPDLPSALLKALQDRAKPDTHLPDIGTEATEAEVQEVLGHIPPDPGLRNTTKRLGPGIDTRGEGGYVIVPGSVAPAGPYVACNWPFLPETLPPVPEALLEALQGQPKTVATPFRIDTGASQGWAEAALSGELGRVKAAQEGGRNDTLNLAAFALAQIVAGGELDGDIVQRQLMGAALAVGLGEVEARATIASGMAAGRQEPRGPKTEIKAKPTGRKAKTSDKLASFDLIEDDRGRIIWCAENAGIVLEQSPAWDGVFAYDEFAGLTMLQKPLPGSTVPKSTFCPRPITDSDLTHVLRWFNRNGFPDATRMTANDAVNAVARANTFSPVQDYLNALAWDGKPRAGAWLSAYCGAAPSPLTGKQGQAWLVSAVARALKPGCKADCALVLEGNQGVGKSSAISVMAGDDWFYDGLHDLHSKDASAGLRGKWIIELPELSAMRRTETEGVKAFLSRTTERYRPAYGRYEVIEPRRCVFAGTTNRTDWLTDDTGGRRFWPVALGNVDLQALARDRDQLWAEAVALYKAGAKWWLDREDEAEAAVVVALRAADDPWSAAVLNAVVDRSEVSTLEMFQILGIDIERQTKTEQMRLSGILTRAGWTKTGKFTGGVNRGLARFVPPVPGSK